jgi:ABC-type transport system involved in cytochrome bd biosynthesis fused ATPase/permease subunit
MAFCSEITPILVVLFTFIVYSMAGNDLTADAAFVSIYVFGRMRIPLTLAPTAVTKVIQISVSLHRIQDLLLADELVEKGVAHTLSDHSKLSIVVNNASFAWSNNIQSSLKNITMEVNKGELVAIGEYPLTKVRHELIGIFQSDLLVLVKQAC